MENLFCNQDDNILEKITTGLSEHLFEGITTSLLQERYKEMIDHFNKPLTEWIISDSYKYAAYYDMAIPLENIKDKTLASAQNI
jgi:hypothetical protein